MLDQLIRHLFMVFLLVIFLIFCIVEIYRLNIYISLVNIINNKLPQDANNNGFKVVYGSGNLVFCRPALVNGYAGGVCYAVSG